MAHTYVLDGSEWEPMPKYTQDSSTRAMNTIEYEHHEIHAGSHFFYKDFSTLGSGVSMVYMLSVADSTKWPHFTFGATGSAITEFKFYEDCAHAGGTEEIIYNSNRNSATSSNLTINKYPSAGAYNGSILWHQKSGAATQQSRTSASTERRHEIILKQNTKYLFKVISGTASNLVNVVFEWYEHTNKN